MSNRLDKYFKKRGESLIKLWIHFCIWFTNKILYIGDCCSSCRDYDKCYKDHVEYEMQNTLEHPACKHFTNMGYGGNCGEKTFKRK
jgi:hypothetical protein